MTADVLPIKPLRHPPSGTIHVPGSKSMTNRALILAALAQGSCEIWNPLQSEDTSLMVKALKQLGFDLGVLPEVILLKKGHGPLELKDSADLFVGNSGTTMRFLTAFVSLGRGRYRLDGVQRMRERPIEDLLAALMQLGVEARSELGNGCPPVVVHTEGWRNGHVTIAGNVSSQFLSGLLLAAPFASQDTVIQVTGPIVSRPYVDMTLAMVRQFGAHVDCSEPTRFLVPGRQSMRCELYQVEPDASAASYFFAAAAIQRGVLTVWGIPEQSLQGDIRFVNLLADMGCRVERCSSGVTVHGRALHGIDVDMNDISDTVMTLAAVACFGEGPTTIRNVAHIRHKETDRLAALATELRKVGAEVEGFADGLTITPRPLHGAEIETYNDHRMAMSMALIGLRVPGIIIKNPGCVAKTYPGFWTDLEKLRS
jgi:3-phosphoshikimate 1-carboxyvinyltransferase